MAVVGLLEHLCSLMDTQPSEVTPLFFEFRIEFLPDGWKKVENSFLLLEDLEEIGKLISSEEDLEESGINGI